MTKIATICSILITTSPVIHPKTNGKWWCRKNPWVTAWPKKMSQMISKRLKPLLSNKLTLTQIDVRPRVPVTLKLRYSNLISNSQCASGKVDSAHRSWRQMTKDSLKLSLNWKKTLKWPKMLVKMNLAAHLRSVHHAKVTILQTRIAVCESRIKRKSRTR